MRLFLLSTFYFLLCTSCANHHFRVATEAAANAPRYIELQKEVRIATLHFPAGLYSFYALDDAGYYYRTPAKIVQHTGGASVMRDGGIYLSKRNTKKLRGYAMMPGGLTHVGDLSRSRYEFRD